MEGFGRGFESVEIELLEIGVAGEGTYLWTGGLDLSEEAGDRNKLICMHPFLSVSLQAVQER